MRHAKGGRADGPSEFRRRGAPSDGLDRDEARAAAARRHVLEARGLADIVRTAEQAGQEALDAALAYGLSRTRAYRVATARFWEVACPEPGEAGESPGHVRVTPEDIRTFLYWRIPNLILLKAEPYAWAAYNKVVDEAEHHVRAQLVADREKYAGVLRTRLKLNRTPADDLGPWPRLEEAGRRVRAETQARYLDALEQRMKHHGLRYDGIRRRLIVRRRVDSMVEAEATAAYTGELERRTLADGLHPADLSALMDFRAEERRRYDYRVLPDPNDPDQQLYSALGPLAVPLDQWHTMSPDEKKATVARAREAWDEKLEHEGQRWQKAVGDDQLTRDIATIIDETGRYWEVLPPIRAGADGSWVEIFQIKRPDSPLREIWARYPDGTIKRLVEAHMPSMDFPRLYPDGLALSPDGRHLAYTSVADLAERGALLHVIDTHTGEAVIDPVAHADTASLDWLAPGRLVFAAGPFGKRSVSMLDVDTAERVPVEDPPASDDDHLGDREWISHRSIAAGVGPTQAYVAVTSTMGAQNAPGALRVVNPSRNSANPTGDLSPVVVHEDTQTALTQPQFTSDGRMYVLSWSDDWSRGRIAEVPLATAEHRGVPGEEPWRDARPHTWRNILSPGDGAHDVIREFRMIERGPGRDPLFVLRMTHHGTAKVVLFDPETRRRVRLDMTGMGPEVRYRDGTPAPGVFGDISGFSVTKDAHGLDVVEIAHSSVASVPTARRFTLNPHWGKPGARAVLSSRDVRTGNEGSNADALFRDAQGRGLVVTLHEFLSHDGHIVRGFHIRRADAKQRGTLMFTTYQNFFWGNNKGRRMNDVHAAHLALGGELWINEGRGSGAEGYRHARQGMNRHRNQAVMDGTSGIDYILARGIARKGEIAGSVQSAAPVVGNRIAFARPDAFGFFMSRREVGDIPTQLEVDEYNHEHGGPDAPHMSPAAYMIAGAKSSQVRAEIDTTVDLRRIGGAGKEVFFQSSRTTSDVYLKVASEGHFAGLARKTTLLTEAGEEMAMLLRLMGREGLDDLLSSRAATLRQGRGLDPGWGRRGPSSLDPSVVSVFTPLPGRVIGGVRRVTVKAVRRPRFQAPVPTRSVRTARWLGKEIHP